MKIEHVAPEDIERRSFEIISEELERRSAALRARRRVWSALKSSTDP